MSVEAKGDNSLEKFGFHKVPLVIYEEQRPGLPENFDLPNGWRCLRTGVITGGISRPPAEDWIVGPPKGPNRSVPLAAIFVYDPEAGEVRVERASKIGDYFLKREELLTKGWQLVPSCLDRVVGYRKFTSDKLHSA